MFKLPVPNMAEAMSLSKSPEEILGILEKLENNKGSLTKEDKDFLENISPLQVNPCGDCNVCCHAPAIKKDDIDGKHITEPKPACVKCPNSTPNGCSVYSSRPEVCRSYLCLYAMGCVDIHPKLDNVAFTINLGPNGEGVVVGHALSIVDVFKSVRMVDMLMEIANSGKVHGIVVMDDQQTVSIDCKTGETMGADIDQNSPLKNEVVQNSIKRLGYGVPYLVP